MRATFYRMIVAVALLCASVNVGYSQIFTNAGATIKTTSGAIVQVNGSMSNSSGSYSNTGTTTITGNLSNNGTVGDSGTINLAGDWINNSTFNRYIGTVVMDGTTQNFSGTAHTDFNNLTILGGSTKTFNIADTVDGLLNLTSGVLITTQTYLLTFTTNGTWSNGSTASYINGPAAKNFNSTTEFQYPIGKNGRYNTVAVQPSSATPTTFRTEYFNYSYPNTTSMLSPLKVVSDIHYWNVDRTSGSANAYVRLYWISGDYNLPSYLSDLSNLTVAMWNGADWIDTGRTSATGNYVSGNIQSHLVTIWGLSPNQHFTLGSDSTDNGLPVELDHFVAKQAGNNVKLEWLTRSEIENLGFEIERSQIGQQATLVQSWRTDPAIAAKSPYGADYNAADAPPADGVWEYDLYQRDMNGARWFLASQTVLFSHVPDAGALDLTIYPNPITESSTQLRIGLQQSAQNVQIDVFDVAGRRVLTSSAGALAEGYHTIPLNGLDQCVSGHYTVVVHADGKSIVKPMLITR